MGFNMNMCMRSGNKKTINWLDVTEKIKWWNVKGF